MRRTIVSVAILLVILAAVTKYVSGPTETIKIGFVSPLSGDAASYGDPVKHGVEIAVSEINARGGIEGRLIEVIYEDGKCNSKDAVNAAQKLISVDNVKIIVGMICSSEMLAIAPIAESSKVILMGLGSSPDITDAGDYVFRTFPSDSTIGQALVDKMIIENHKKLALLSENTAYAQGLRNFVYTVAQGKLDIVADEVFNTGVTDFRTLLQKIKLTDPDAILINPQTAQSAARMTEQARLLGINAQFYGAYYSGPEFVKSGPHTEGAFIAGFPKLDVADARVADFIEESKRRYGTEPSCIFCSASAYDQIYIIAHTIDRVGIDDTKKMRDYLYELDGFSGLTGRLGFDTNGDVEGIKMTLTVVKNGGVELVK